MYSHDQDQTANGLLRDQSIHPLLFEIQQQHVRNGPTTPSESSTEMRSSSERSFSVGEVVSTWDPLSFTMKFESETSVSRSRNLSDRDSPLVDTRKSVGKFSRLHSRTRPEVQTRRHPTNSLRTRICRPTVTYPSVTVQSFTPYTSNGSDGINASSEYLLPPQSTSENGSDKSHLDITPNTTQLDLAYTTQSLQPPFDTSGRFSCSPPGAKPDSRCLPSSTLLWPCMPPSNSDTITNSELQSTSTTSRRFRKAGGADILSISTGELMAWVFGSDRSDQHDLKDTQLVGGEAQVPSRDTAAGDQSTRRRRSVHWTMSPSASRQDDIDEILKSYYELETNRRMTGRWSSRALDVPDTEEIQTKSARDLEKERARTVFVRHSDWRNRGKISDFLRQTKDLYE